MQRIATPDNQVRVFTGFQRAHVFVNAKLFGGVERDEFEGFFGRNLAVFHGLGCLVIQVTGQLGIV